MSCPRPQRLLAATVMFALGLALGGCSTSGGGFDPTDLLDFLDTKKKLPGDRKVVFPGGVPGIEQGVPKDLYKGANAQADQPPQVEPASPPPAASKKKATKSAARAKPATPAAAPPAASAPAAEPDAAEPESEEGTAAAPPAPPPPKTKRTRATSLPKD